MLWPEVVCLGGVVAGLRLLRLVPLVGSRRDGAAEAPHVTVVVPARNEETNLPALLRSVPPSQRTEVVVVDDSSTDKTACVASQCGARVVQPGPLPSGWTGKTWACDRGAQAASAGILFFVDADVWFVDGGYERCVGQFMTMPNSAVLSVLPYHRMRCWYEELSLFFHVLMAMGAGGFGGVGACRLFGQSMIVRREMYEDAGGHSAVRRHVLENLHFAAAARQAGGAPYTLGGRGAMEMRMFPEGMKQLVEGWTKGFVDGAKVTAGPVLWLSVYWLAAAFSAAVLLLMPDVPRAWSVSVYVLFAAQVLWYARQLGSYRVITAVAYPIPLVFYFVLFGRAAWLQLWGRPVVWRGREV